ncbi:uncharacterized protein [Primulina huaijiensis]|uniref:uncharacterized protein n=1 Tax=Primulina huaijiensis TaxID=1492673 RepID=UPI003CC77919
MDYFSKWVEAEPLARITENDVLKFLWKNIVCRYGVPRRLISDNGRQFQGAKIQAWCKEMKIQQFFTSVAYPQTEIGLESARVMFYDEENGMRRDTNLDLLEDKREATSIRMEAHKNLIAQSYNRRVVQRSFQVGDLILRKVQEEQRGKLHPKWEGPFKMIEKLSSGDYYLENTQGKALKRPWSAYHLRKYHSRFYH